MSNNCPNLICNFYLKSTFVIKDGTFYRADDSRKIQRYKCKECNQRFSASTSKLEYCQKKRRVNIKLFELLASGVSLRRSARLLKIHRETARKKLIYLGEKSRWRNENFNKALEKSKVLSMQFDDLITKENSKLKPLSVSIAVDADRRFILGAEVSQIPSFGLIAKRARQKYGKRSCHHVEGLNRLFQKILITTDQSATIRSDEHSNYEKIIAKYFPNSNYFQHKSERAHVAGQGELKKVNFDPLFMINHTCAMLRANINRLVRKTWCTTKDKERLKDHLEIFICYFNKMLYEKNGFS